MKNMWKVTHDDMKVSRRLRTLLFRLGIESAFSWDLDIENWEVS